MRPAKLLAEMLRSGSQKVRRIRRLSILVAVYRKLQFYPGSLKLGAWRVDYGPSLYPVFTEKIEIPLKKLQFDNRALAEMRLIMESQAPSPELSEMLRDRFGTDFDARQTPLYFERWSSLLEFRGEFTVCATVGSSGELSIIDGAHRCATAVLQGRSSITGVLGVRRNSTLAR